MLDPEMKNTKDFYAFSEIRRSELKQLKLQFFLKALFIIKILLKTTLFPLYMLVMTVMV